MAVLVREGSKSLFTFLENIMVNTTFSGATAPGLEKYVGLTKNFGPTNKKKRQHRPLVYLKAFLARDLRFLGEYAAIACLILRLGLTSSRLPAAGVSVELS